MLTSVDVKFIFDSACLWASLGDKGLFAANIVRIVDSVFFFFCLLAVLAMFSAKSSPIFSSWKSEMLRYFVVLKLPKQLNLVLRSSIIWQFCCTIDVISSHIAKFFHIWSTVAGYEIMRGILANQEPVSPKSR